MKPICIKCQRFFKCVKNGVVFVEAMPRVEKPEAGKYHPEHWTPYKVWLGDKYQCPGCLHEIISGVGQGPVSEHFKDDFKEYLKHVEVTVNDC